MFPRNASQVTAADPATPAGLNLGPGMPCVYSVSGETYGRYDNVDVAHNVRLGKSPKAPGADVAIVSDRGCDRMRFFKIDLDHPDGPLVDITSPNAPRVFPRRYEQPSELQPSGAAEGWIDNPVCRSHGHTGDRGWSDRLFSGRKILEQHLEAQTPHEPVSKQYGRPQRVKEDPPCSVV
jgi:hypothetical protein